MAQHGTKKFGMASVTAFGGMAAGQDVLKWTWDMVASILLYYGLPVHAMSEVTAANLFSIGMLIAFYWVTEEDGSRKITEEEIAQFLKTYQPTTPPTPTERGP